MKKRTQGKKRRPKTRLGWTRFQSLGPETNYYIVNDGNVRQDTSELFVNSRYQVHKCDDGDVIHLSIKRLDGQVLQDWRELQCIKNELLGDEVEAVQLHPAESRLVDMCDQIHLWALKQGSFPFGFIGRVVSEGTVLPGQTQRPFERKPTDLQQMADVCVVEHLL